MDENNKRVPTNTTEAMKDPANNLAFLAEGMLRGGSVAIENQEARGQQELVNSDVLPTEGSNDPAWEKMGVKYGKPVEGDLIFRHVTLPTGWKKRSTSHAMWNDLVDDKDRVRATFFYKAAFYDRSAHINPVRRFEAAYEPEGGFSNYEPDAKCHAIVKDCGKEIYRSPAEHTGNKDTYESAGEKARKAAKAWLQEHYPNADDPCAYWDQ